MKKIVRASILAVGTIVVLAGSAFATDLEDFDDSSYEGLRLYEKDNEHQIRCTSYKDGDELIPIYGATSADCSEAWRLVQDLDAWKELAGTKEDDSSTKKEECPKEEKKDDEPKKDDGLGLQMVIMIIALCFSVAINIVLVILLIKKGGHFKNGPENPVSNGDNSGNPTPGGPVADISNPGVYPGTPTSGAV